MEVSRSGRMKIEREWESEKERWSKNVLVVREYVRRTEEG